jgi:hypothetical protein
MGHLLALGRLPLRPKAILVGSRLGLAGSAVDFAQLARQQGAHTVPVWPGWRCGPTVKGGMA